MLKTYLSYVNEAPGYQAQLLKPLLSFNIVLQGELQCESV
jgi:hypothetical protein